MVHQKNCEDTRWGIEQIQIPQKISDYVETNT